MSYLSIGPTISIGHIGLFSFLFSWPVAESTSSEPHSTSRGIKQPNSGVANANINFYDDGGYRLCLHVSFRPSTNVLHISQWWAPFSKVFADTQQGRDGWLRVVRNTDFFYDFETFNLDDHDERIHGATWSVTAAAWTVQSVKYAGSPSLLGDSTEVHI
ncbi:hypothetical protein BDV30DRAFT_44709 [Aspergillus minisclerotigenes]|uniref:Uncharacterized protein n=1 Tax=Aspergillus minisclerotigenes TaxID=656917 RepID=A0A5N6IKI9_9EURO|nr:hypothetical protein BDV30DRAFT_44709 [Aspergillus minisclerotigenes]